MTRTQDRILPFSLSLGGAAVLAVAAAVWGREGMTTAVRGFLLALGGCLLCLGASRLLAARSPAWASRLEFAGKALVGCALFSLSWAVSHR